MSTAPLKRRLRNTVYGKTEVGKRRTVNQDALWYEPYDSRHGVTILLVADGVGGNLPHGERASTAAVAGFEQAFAQTDPQSSLLSRVEIAINGAQDKVLTEAENLDVDRIGTTLVGLVIQDGHAVGLNIGDSRLYRLRNHELEAISVDQTRLTNSGVLRNELEKRDSRINSYLGQPKTLIPYYYELAVEEGDLYLLCTDGLWSLMTLPELQHEVLENETLEDIAARLIDIAMDRGAPDNVTLALAQIGDRPARHVAPTVAGTDPPLPWWGLVLAAAIIGMIVGGGVGFIAGGGLDSDDSSDANSASVAVAEEPTATSTETLEFTTEPSATPTAPPTETPTEAPTATPTETSSPEPSATATDTLTPTPTYTPSLTPISTLSDEQRTATQSVIAATTTQAALNITATQFATETQVAGTTTAVAIETSIAATQFATETQIAGTSTSEASATAFASSATQDANLTATAQAALLASIVNLPALGENEQLTLNLDNVPSDAVYADNVERFGQLLQEIANNTAQTANVNSNADATVVSIRLGPPRDDGLRDIWYEAEVQGGRTFLIVERNPLQRPEGVLSTFSSPNSDSEQLPDLNDTTIVIGQYTDEDGARWYLVANLQGEIGWIQIEDLDDVDDPNRILPILSITTDEGEVGESAATEGQETPTADSENVTVNESPTPAEESTIPDETPISEPIQLELTETTYTSAATDPPVLSGGDGQGGTSTPQPTGAAAVTIDIGTSNERCAQVFDSRGYNTSQFIMEPTDISPYNDNRIYTLFLPNGTNVYIPSENIPIREITESTSPSQAMTPRLVRVLNVARPEQDNTQSIFLVEYDSETRIVSLDEQTFGAIVNVNINARNAPGVFDDNTTPMEQPTLDILAFTYEYVPVSANVLWFYGVQRPMLENEAWFATSVGGPPLGVPVVDNLGQPDADFNLDLIPFANYLPDHLLLEGNWQNENQNLSNICGLRLLSHNMLQVFYLDGSTLNDTTLAAQIAASEESYCFNLTTSVNGCNDGELEEGNRSFLILGTYVDTNGARWYYVKTHDIADPLWIPANRLVDRNQVDNSQLPTLTLVE